MDTRLTIRQILFLFLFLSISGVFNYVPNLAAFNAGGSGYISVLYVGVLLFIYAGLLLQILKAYPNRNMYEVLKAVIGEGFAKAIIFLYAIWAYINVIMKVGAYSVTLQATLMPSIHPGILLVILFLLILYTLSKNERTIFRFAEFLYQPIIFFLAIIFLFALPDLDFKSLVPVTLNNLEDNLYTIPDILSLGGNLVLVIFFCKHLVYSGDERNIRKHLMNTVAIFLVICILSIILSVGTNGIVTTSTLSYPIFQAVKSVSILSTFERMDSLITMIIMMSDFVGIVVFLQLTMLCLGWVFNYQKEKEGGLLNDKYSQSLKMNNSLKVYGVALLFIACSYILLTKVTQFEFETYYRRYQVYINMAFQFVVPVLLGFVSLIKEVIQSGRNGEDEKIIDSEEQPEAVKANHANE